MDRSMDRGPGGWRSWSRLLTWGVIASGGVVGLSGCGGGESRMEQARQGRSVVAMQVPGAERVAAASAGVPARPVTTVDELFNWAEQRYPELFPSHSGNAGLSPYVYRFYPGTQTYLGVDGSQVVALGPFTNGQIQTFGRVSDFACQVDPSNCSGGPLAGRTWGGAALLEQGDQPVQGQLDYALDDSGRVLVAFQKFDGQRNVLQATWVQAGPDGRPQFDPAVPIDTNAGAVLTATDGVRVAVSPAGHAVITWITTRSCSATTYRTSGTCRYLYATRQLAGQQQWEPPVLLADSPGDPRRLRINDRGDVAVWFPGWVRSGTSSFSAREAVALRPAAQATYTVQTLTGVVLEEGDFGMDASGGLVLAGSREQNSTTDIVVFRGNVDGGLGNQEVVDQRGSAATFQSLAVGIQGQSLVLWTQNNGTEVVLYGAVGSGQVPYSVTELGPRETGSYEFSTLAVATDNGELIANSFNRRVLRRWTQGVWSSPEAVPTGWVNNGTHDRFFDRNGNMLAVHTGIAGSCITGAWHSYDAFRNTLVKPLATAGAADFVTGISLCNKGAGLEKPRLSAGGKGAILMVNGYDVLPSPQVPAGDRRSVSNLWIALLN